MKRIFNYFVLVILSMSLMIFSHLSFAVAADDEPLVLVKYGDIPGDVLIDDYTGYTYAKEISLAMSNDCSPLEVDPCDNSFENITITRYAGYNSGKLAVKCITHDIIGAIEIVSLFSAKNSKPQWEIILYSAIIQKVASAVTIDGRLMEAIEINPAAIAWKFYEYDESGKEIGCNYTQWNRGDDVWVNSDCEQ